MVRILSGLKKSEVVFLVILTLIPLIKLYSLNTGILSVEPDEANHIEVVRSLREGTIPRYFGQPFFYGPPAFFYLSVIVSFFTHDDFLSVRLVSLFASIVTGIAIFFYLRWKTNSLFGFLGGLIYIFIPILMFYSRIGMLETTLGMFGFLFFFMYEAATVRSSLKLYIVSGVLLGLALLTKLTAILLFIIPAVYCCYRGIIWLTGVLRTKSVAWKDVWNLVKPSLPVFIGLGLLLPVMMYYYSVEPVYFKEQVRYILGFGNKGASWNDLVETIAKYVLMFTPSILIVFVYGLFVSFLTPRFRFLGICFVLLAYMLIRNPLSLETLRYFVFPTSWMVVITTMGLFSLYQRIRNNRIHVLRQYSYLVVVGLGLILSLAHPSAMAFEGTVHSEIKNMGIYLKNNLPRDWVFSNYWPTVFVVYSGNYNTSWLSANKYDTAAFSTPKESHFGSITVASNRFVNTYGAYVIIQKPATLRKNIYSRSELAQQVTQHGQKIVEFRDTNSFYPHNQVGESFTLYRVEPGYITNIENE